MANLLIVTVPAWKFLCVRLQKRRIMRMIQVLRINLEICSTMCQCKKITWNMLNMRTGRHVHMPEVNFLTPF